MGSDPIYLLLLLIAMPGVAGAQQLPHGPAALDVPHPIPPMQLTGAQPPDLYHQLTPSPIVQPVVVGGFVYPALYGGYYYAVADSTPEPKPKALPHGWLRFETEPATAQVYADGFYVGLTGDFGVTGRTLDLSAGAHHIELRAPGYLTQSFDVNVISNDTTRYRGDLVRSSADSSPAMPRAAAPAPPASAVAPAMYIIPNCYAGTRPPVRPLPAGCSVKDLVRR